LIISASYKTDIPAFYGKWFLHRLREGYCRTVNAYNRKVSLVDLSRNSVDGIVFWTKDPSPFMDGFRKVEQKGYPFYVQYTITGYPNIIEKGVPSREVSIDVFRNIAGQFGSHSAVWRYDPILFSSLTDERFHLQNFSGIAESLAGYTTEVVVSFARFYRKCRKRVQAVSKKEGVTFYDPGRQEKMAFLARLSAIARSNGMELSLCGQRDLLAEGVGDASCIDPFRLSRVAGTAVPVPPKRSHRPGEGCGCYQARDIGEYDTCLHGCIYCYAVSDRERAVKNFRRHITSGEFLLSPEGPSDGPDTLRVPEQRTLFKGL
jgi:hypothetical protein